MLPRFMGPSSPAPIVSKAIGNRATTSNLLNQMALSAAQQKYYAYWLTRSLPSDSLGKLTASLQDAQVDLTPHQIDAALFAFKSPAINRVLPEIDASLADIIAAQRTEIKLRKSESKKTSRLDEKVRLQRLIKDLEKRRSEKRLNLYQAQDEIDEKKETLLAKVEALLTQKIDQTNQNIPTYYDDVDLLNHVVMPIHLHMVLAVGTRLIASAEKLPSSSQGFGCIKPPRHGVAVIDNHHNSKLASIIGAFKAGVTRTARTRLIASLPCWQSRYHEHIVRNQRKYDSIMEYIDNNIVNWNTDCFYHNGTGQD